MILKKPDKTSAIPLYYQIENQIEKMIRSRALSPGDKLPGDVELSADLGVNSRTVRQALEGLVSKGLIRRIKKSGKFVNDNVLRGIPSIGFFYFAEAESVMAKRAEYAQQYLSLHGYDLKIVPFDRDYYDHTDLWEQVREKRLAGAIFVALPGENCRRRLSELEKRGFPHVRMGNHVHCDRLSAPLIRGNDEKEVTDALTYLWNLGHRRIGFIATERECVTDSSYLEFYRGRPFEDRWLMYLNFSGPPEQYIGFPGVQLARGYLDMNPDITALVVGSACFCVDLLRETETMNRRVPDDLSVICLADYLGLMCTTRPRVTSVMLSPQAEAGKTCEMLLAVLNGTWRKEDKLVLVDYEFTERDSVAPAKELVEV